MENNLIFANVKSIQIPEGIVKQITDASGNVLWSGKKGPIPPPAKYTLYDYIQAASSNCWIDLGFAHTVNTSIDVDVEFASFPSSGSTPLYGARTSNGSADSFYTLVYTSSSGTTRPRWGVNAGYVTVNTVSIAKNRIYSFHLDLKSFSIKDVYSVDTGKTSVGTYPGNDWLLKIHGYSDQNRNVKLHSFKAYEGTTQTRDMIPVLDTETNTFGLFDRIEGKFYSSAGSSAFTGGSPI